MAGCITQVNHLGFENVTSGTQLTETVPFQPKASATIRSTLTKKNITPSPSFTNNAPYTKTPTITSLPTLSKIEAENTILQLFTATDQCQLPCFFGLTPGVDNINHAKELFASFSQNIYESENFRGFMAYISPPPEYSNSPYVIVKFSSDGNIIDTIFTFRYKYPIKDLLEEYGEPNESYFYLSDPLSSPAEFDLVFFYSDQGFVASYDGEVEYGEKVEICSNTPFSGQDGPYLILWSPDNQKTLNELQRINPTSFMNDLELYVPLEEVLINAKLDDFFTMFINSADQSNCLEIANPNIR